jgi:hypothetical protein
MKLLHQIFSTFRRDQSKQEMFWVILCHCMPNNECCRGYVETRPAPRQAASSRPTVLQIHQTLSEEIGS